MTNKQNPWISYRKPHTQARLRLFCFPYAGGAASIFRTWADELPPEVDVCPIQFPGRESRLTEQPFTEFTSLVQAMTRYLQPYLNIPFAFFGHSMGALISFEFARYLRQQYYLSPVQLFISGCSAPQVFDFGRRIHDLPEPEFLQEVRQLKGTPDEVLEHPELMQLLLPVLRADFGAVETYTYTPGEPLDCMISVFGGLKDEEVSREDLEAWQQQTRGAFNLRLFPGDHFFLHSDRALLLRTLSEDLTRLLNRIPSNR
jgi:surfactin synthase thioesterase subunit